MQKRYPGKKTQDADRKYPLIREPTKADSRLEKRRFEDKFLSRNPNFVK